jgi:hypothetical protein
MEISTGIAVVDFAAVGSCDEQPRRSAAIITAEIADEMVLIVFASIKANDSNSCQP